MPEPRITEVDMLFMEPRILQMITELPLEFHKEYAAELLFIPRLIPEIQQLRQKAGKTKVLMGKLGWLETQLPARIAASESMTPKEQRDGPTV